MKYFDQHLHSEYSVDSEEKAEAYLLKAAERGVPRFITTEHVEFDWNNEHVDYVPDFAEQKALYDSLRKKFPSVDIMQGVEIGYRSEHLDKINALIEKNDFDLINLSVHDYMGYDMYFYDPKNVPSDEMLRYNFEKIVEAAKSDIDYDVLCHVDYAFKSAHHFDKSLKIAFYEDFLKKIFAIVIERGKALEINLKVQRAIADREHIDYMLRLYRALGGKILTLSGDTHALSDYLFVVEKYAAIIKENGFDSLRFFDRKKPYDVLIDELF